MNDDDNDYPVTVCSACLTATCWHGMFMCMQAWSAGTTTRLASELRALGREHPDHYSPESIREVTGSYPHDRAGNAVMRS